MRCTILLLHRPWSKPDPSDWASFKLLAPLKINRVIIASLLDEFSSNLHHMFAGSD